MNIFERIAQFLKSTPTWSASMEGVPILQDVHSVMKIIYKYNPNNTGVKIPKVAFDDQKQMREDMQELSALLVWVAVLLGKLRGAEKVGGIEVKEETSVNYLKNRPGNSADKAKEEAKVSAFKISESLRDLQEIICIVDNCYSAGNEFVNVLKRNISYAREDKTI